MLYDVRTLNIWIMRLVDSAQDLLPQQCEQDVSLTPPSAAAAQMNG